MSDNYEVKQLTLVSLAYRCRRESERFQRGLSSDASFCYELWRRALEDRDEEAWTFVYAQYERLLISYVRRHPAFADCYQQPADFVQEMLARVWSAIPPERFHKFPNLPAILKFLQVSIYRLVMDKCRTEQPLPPPLTESINLPRFWDCVEQQAKSEEEVVIIRERIRDERKPAEIAKRHPTLFRNTKEVYRKTEYLRARIYRDSSGELKNCLENVLG